MHLGQVMQSQLTSTEVQGKNVIWDAQGNVTKGKTPAVGHSSALAAALGVVLHFWTLNIYLSGVVEVSPQSFL